MELGWIDFSKEDRKKALDVINLLTESGAVDELGIGIVRDAFSNYFFPGTSTVQTRAKYFLIVPYAIKDILLNPKIKSTREAVDALDFLEKNSATIMYRKGERNGLIGVNNMPFGWVQRAPSVIYWSGIKKFEIVKNTDLNIGDLFRYYISIYKEKKDNTKLLNRLDDPSDDQDDIDAGDISLLQYLNIPTYKKSWKNNLKLDLTKDEAHFLKSQIIKVVPDSLLAYILKNNINISQYNSFMECSEDVFESVSNDNKEAILLANSFNELVYLIRVRYNYLLSDGKNADAVKRWDEIENSNFIDNLQVDIRKIFYFFRLSNPPTKYFLEKALEYSLNRDYKSLDELLKAREIKLKGPARAKLNHIGETDTEKWVGGYYLDYRFSRAKAIIEDIYKGETENA